MQAAILNGDQESGVTIMRMDAGVDTGPVLSQAALPILPDDTADSLGRRMAELGASLLWSAAGLSGWSCVPQAQDDSQRPMHRCSKKNRAS